jgi:dihydroorotase
MDLVVCGNAYLEGKLVKCCIGSENGKIVSIKKILKGDRFYDFGDKLILPAGIDIHVHFREPGMTHKEDFETGSLSAAFGGIGTVLDMPNTKPPVTDPDSLENKISIAKKKSFIDFGIYSAVTASSNLGALSGLSTGFKLYLGETTGNLTYNDLNELGNKIQSLGNTRTGVLAVHAESSEVLNRMSSEIPEESYKNLIAHSKRRPAEAELKAVNGVINLYKNIYSNGSSPQSSNLFKFHLCHISSSASVNLLKNYQKLSTEVTPHHLFLNTRDHENLGTLGKVNPPVRSKDEQIKLWQEFCSGNISILASDHAPHTMDEKEQPFYEAPSGMPGVETMLPLILSRLKHGDITMDRMVDAAAVRPAKLFGFNKGTLAEGKDADLIVVDMKRETILKENMLHSKCGWTPYKNMPVVMPVMTVSGGRVITREDGIEAEPGEGRFLKSN